LDERQKERVRALGELWRDSEWRTRSGLDVLEVLVAALGRDGQLDLSHQTIASRAKCSVATVKRELTKLRSLGLVDWTRRLVRGSGTKRRTEQTSNAYVLRPEAAEPTCTKPRASSDAQNEREEGYRNYMKNVAGKLRVPNEFADRHEDEKACQSRERQLEALGYPIVSPRFANGTRVPVVTNGLGKRSAGEACASRPHNHRPPTGSIGGGLGQ
jgi:hypothetical protein